MKTILFTLLTLAFTVNCYAQRFESWSNDNTINVDGSQTIKNARLIRGSRSYLIAGSPEGVCIALGFDSFLAETAFTNLTDEQVATINSFGEYSSLTTPSGNRFYSSITCYRRSMLRTVVKMSRYDNNADRTVTLIEPRIVRGSRTYFLAGSPTGVCRAMGYENVLPDSAMTRLTDEVTANINSFGEYSSLTTPSGNRFYSEITCYTRGPQTILRDERGDYYFRRP